MKAYEDALFLALVWSQAVEERARDLAVRWEESGRLELTDRQRRGLPRATLGRVIEYLKPCIDSDPHESLDAFCGARNDVVHRSSYVTNILAWSIEPDDAAAEIRRFEEIKLWAGGLFGALIDLYPDEHESGRS